MQWYAQASAAFDSANWNDNPSGSGNPGSPQSGDDVEANGFDIDCAGKDFISTPVNLLTVNGGSFWSSAWYAQAAGNWNEAQWNAAPAGNGLTGSPDGDAPGVNTAHDNSYSITCDEIVLTNINLTNDALNGDFHLNQGYAQADGAIHEIAWNGRADGAGLTAVATVSLHANGHHVVGALSDVAARTVCGDTGSFTIGDSPAVFPDEADVRQAVEYGPTGADFTGTLTASVLLVATIIGTAIAACI